MNIQPGTVIRATMRNADLIPCFAGLLAELDPSSYGKLCDVYPELTQLPDDDGDWFDSEDASELCHSLFDCLDACAPAGLYFGAHPGDGSDYGFWECEQDSD